MDRGTVGRSGQKRCCRRMHLPYTSRGPHRYGAPDRGARTILPLAPAEDITLNSLGLAMIRFHIPAARCVLLQASLTSARRRQNPDIIIARMRRRLVP